MALPFVRLGGSYALFFAVMGLLAPYWGRTCGSRGMTQRRSAS